MIIETAYNFLTFRPPFAMKRSIIHFTSLYIAGHAESVRVSKTFRAPAAPLCRDLGMARLNFSPSDFSANISSDDRREKYAYTFAAAPFLIEKS